MYLDDLSLILNDKKCNFLAMAITPYQAVGVNAAISYLRQRGVEIQGYILMTSHPDTGRVLDSSLFLVDKQKIKCVEFDYEYKKENLIKKIATRIDQLTICRVKKNGVPFYFVWTEILNNALYAIRESSFNYDLHFIKIDDGAASYLEPFECRRSYLLYAAGDNKLKRINANVKAWGYSIITKYCENGLKNRNRMINANIFVRDMKRDQLIRNTLFSTHYADVFSKVELNKETYEQFNQAVVVNSQGLGEFGITDGVIDYKCLETLANMLNKNYKVVIKPHPREKEIDKYMKLGWIVVDNTVAQEVILSNSKPKCLISFFSSTLLNAKGLFNIPVISLAKILLNEEISDTFRHELVRYIDMYKDIVLFPDSYNELELIIKQL